MKLKKLKSNCKKKNSLDNILNFLWCTKTKKKKAMKVVFLQ